LRHPVGYMCNTDSNTNVVQHCTLSPITTSILHCAEDKPTYIRAMNVWYCY